MELRIGEVFVNKTSRYLAPIIQTYHKKFYKALSLLSRLAWGIGDYKYEKITNNKYRYCLYLLIEANEDISEFLEYFRVTDYFIDDYKFDIKSHMLIISLTYKFRLSYKNFLKSKFSCMYGTEFIEKNIQKKLGKDVDNPTYLVLTKAEDYKKTFAEIIYKEYGTDLIIEDDRELDFPIDLSKEIFNWYENENRSFL